MDTADPIILGIIEVLTNKWDTRCINIITIELIVLFQVLSWGPSAEHLINFQECICGYIGVQSKHPSETHFLLDNYPILKNILGHLTKKERIIFKRAFRDNIYLENSLHFQVCTNFYCNCTHMEIITIK